MGSGKEMLEKERVNKLRQNLFSDQFDRVVSISTRADVPALEVEIFRYLVNERGMSGIIICVNRSPNYYANLFFTRGINLKKVGFVNVGFKKCKIKGVKITEAGEPDDLLSIIMTTIKSVKSMKRKNVEKEVFVILDSITTLLMYNNMKRIGRFLHDLNVRLRDLKVGFILIVEPSSRLRDLVSRFCDENIILEHETAEKFARAFLAEVH